MSRFPRSIFDKMMQYRDLTSLALPRKSTGFSAFRKVVTVKLWKRVKSPSVYPSACNIEVAWSLMDAVFEVNHLFQGNLILVSNFAVILKWPITVCLKLHHKVHMPLVSWQESAPSQFWPAPPPLWMHVSGQRTCCRFCRGQQNLVCEKKKSWIRWM